MNEREFKELRETSWRRKLSPAEEARLQNYLAAHPQGQGEFETDLALSHILAQLSDAPLSSNFTARVLQAVERESAAMPRLAFRLDALRQWLARLSPRVAWAAVLLCLGALAWQQHQWNQRSRLAQGVASVLQASAVPEPEMLQDFDAIQQLRQAPFPDDMELLAALSQ
jgi:anti-sigma factor RsiW